METGDDLDYLNYKVGRENNQEANKGGDKGLLGFLKIFGITGTGGNKIGNTTGDNQNEKYKSDKSERVAEKRIEKLANGGEARGNGDIACAQGRVDTEIDNRQDHS